MEAPANITWLGYSLAERDWRWQRVRDSAAKAGFDCVLVPLCVDGRNLHLSLEQSRGTRSDCRFLTQLENAAVVLPTDGRKPIVISDQETGNEWVPEFRPVDGSWGKAMAQALIDAGMERARIGVSGIQRGFYTTVAPSTVSSTIVPTLRFCEGCPTLRSRTPRKLSVMPVMLKAKSKSNV